MILTRAGIGDIFLTRTKVTGEQVCVNKKDLLRYRGMDSRAVDFTEKLMIHLFGYCTFVDSNDYPTLRENEPIKESNLKRYFIQRPKEKFYLFHTKVRNDWETDSMNIKRALGQTFNELKLKYPIVIIGERKVSRNIESIDHNQFNIYNELMKLESNNKVFDCTQEEVYNCPTFNNFLLDMDLIARAYQVIGCGYGGNFAMTWAVSDNYLFWTGQCRAEIIDHIKAEENPKKRLIKDINDFIRELKEL